MIEIALMIEGQMGLNWEKWKQIAQFAEEKGFVGLYRSDHYFTPGNPTQDSLELWTSLTWLASSTQTIEFGPLVTPMSFRNPTQTARMARDVDDLSGGRLTLGLGAGWMEQEHVAYGWELLSIKERFVRFEEALKIITAFMNSDEPVSLEGKYYSVKEASFFPRPSRPGGPPVLVGGSGPKLTLPLVAKYASEWNSLAQPPESLIEKNNILNELLEKQGRKSEEVKRSMMAELIYGRDENELNDLADERSQGELSAAEIAGYGLVVGTASQVVDQLGKLAEAGLQRIMVNYLNFDNLDRLEHFADNVLPQFK